LTDDRVLDNLAGLYEKQEKHQQAESLAQHVLLLQEQMLGTDHPMTQKAQKRYTALVERNDELKKQEEDT